MDLGALGSRVRPINYYYDIGVVGRRTGVTIKPNVKKDADGMDNIEDFWKDGDPDNETKTNKGIASRFDEAPQTKYQKSTISGGTRSSTDLHDQDGIEHARRQHPQHRLTGYIDQIADELPEDLLSTPSSRRVRAGLAGLATRTSDGSNSTSIGSNPTSIGSNLSREEALRSNTISTVSEPPFEEYPSPPFHSVKRKIDFSQTLSDVELEDDEAYILAAISTTRRVATPPANVYGNRSFSTPDGSPPLGENTAYATLQYPRTPRGNNRNRSSDFESLDIRDSMTNRPRSRASYRLRNAQRHINHSAVANSRATSSGNIQVFDLEEGGVDYETLDDRFSSDDQFSIPPPPETPSSFSHGITISKTPDYIANRALIPIPTTLRTNVTSDFNFVDRRNQIYETVPYEVEEPQDASPSGSILGGRASIQLFDHGKVYALEAPQDETGMEGDLATQPIERKIKSNCSKSKNTANVSVTLEVPDRQSRERLPSSPVEDVSRTPKPPKPRRAVSVIQRNATIEAPEPPPAQIHNNEEAEVDATRIRTMFGEGTSAAVETGHFASDQKESMSAHAKDKKKALPQIEQEEQVEVPEARKKSKSKADAVAPVKQRKERETSSAYMVEPVVRKAKLPEAEDESKVRRSRRTKFKPLEFWKNEKLVLGKSDDTPVPLPVVKAVIRAAPVERHQPEAKRKQLLSDQSSSKVKSKTKHLMGKKRQRVDASESVNQDDGGNGQRKNGSRLFEPDQDSSEDGSPQQCETLDDDGNIVIRAVVEEADLVHFQDAPSRQYKYHRGLEDESISSGIVRIPGGGVKPNQNAFASSVFNAVIF
ncbi:hypothetical protein BGX21_008882 [Mortierella sp. AD011]|nr:hypothetical protein BGX20_008945 [Mortierella sp. AD010]KAF9397429.1 hypothetical protein BGX21_008882 [Mortierella sp. AD011]